MNRRKKKFCIKEAENSFHLYLWVHMERKAWDVKNKMLKKCISKYTSLQHISVSYFGGGKCAVGTSVKNEIYELLTLFCTTSKATRC